MRRLAKLINERADAGEALESGYVSASNMDLLAQAWSVERGQRPEPIVNIAFTAGYPAETMAAHGLVPDDVFSADVSDSDIPAEFCDVDHLRRHADGGPTNQRNAGPECRSHNVFKETAGLRSRRTANSRVYLIRPDDSIIMPVGARTPRWADNEPPDDSFIEACRAQDDDVRSHLPAIETMTFNEFLERRNRRASRWHRADDPTQRR